MPIDTRCPHCQKAYRLKDEFLGRKVKCPNPSCQKPFPVEPIPVETAPKARAAGSKKASPTAEQDAEAIAAALFGDDNGPAVPEDLRTIDMVCSSCDHNWSVPFAMKGKNVVCPECRFRQKVPDKKEKKIDWRDPNANRPSLAKGEEIPEELREQMSRTVSDSALVETGVIKEDIEPVPLTVKLQRIAVVLGTVAAIAFVVMYFLKNRQEGKEQRFMDDAIADLDKFTEEGISKGESGLLKSSLFLAAAEHAIRNDTPEQRKLAVERFSQSRQLADQQPRGPERDVLLGELALLITSFGGDEDQVGKEIRLRWSPGERKAGAQLTAGVGEVQTELKRVLVAMSGSELDFRLSVVRVVTRELAKVNRVELLTEILGQGFNAQEMAEATAHMGMELLRAGNAAGAKAVAEQAKVLMTTNPSPTAQALCEATGVPLKTEEKVFNAPAAGQLIFLNRIYGTVLNAANRDINTALVIATRGSADQADDKVRALAILAEWMENTREPLAKADAILTNEGKGKTTVPYSVLRLAILAGQAGQMDVAERFLNNIPDEGLRAWGKAEVHRAKFRANREQKVDLALVDIPTDKTKLRVGHARMALNVARQNAAATGDQSAVKEYMNWPEGIFRSHGLAGLALGIQDRKK